MRLAVQALLIAFFVSTLSTEQAVASTADVRGGRSDDSGSAIITGDRTGSSGGNDTVKHFKGSSGNSNNNTSEDVNAEPPCMITLMSVDETGFTYYQAPCDQADAEPSTTPATTPAQKRAQVQQAAVSYIRQLTMPKPNPQMSAPAGICGVIHTMNLNIPASQNFEGENTAFGQMTATAHGTFTVNWGDSQKDTYTSTGGEYPNSSIKHFWTDRGYYNITVTADWSVDWQLGEYSGVVTGLRTTASINNWRVFEAQAMLVNPSS